MGFDFVTPVCSSGKHANFPSQYVKSGTVTILTASIKTSKAGRIKQCLSLVPEPMASPMFSDSIHAESTGSSSTILCPHHHLVESGFGLSEHKVQCISVALYSTAAKPSTMYFLVFYSTADPNQLQGCGCHFLNVSNFHVHCCG